MIIFNKVTKSYSNGNLVLDEVSFTINKGDFIFITGASGAGKTTISRLLLKEIEPNKGQIFIDQENIGKIKKSKIPALRRKIGTAFQDFKLFSDKTIKENIALPLEILRQAEDLIDKRVKRVLSLVGLEGKEHSFPRQLSGGEIQRVVIGRALIASPKILFADEPTGNLDEDTAWGIMEILKKINEEGTTVIVATHNKGIVKNLGKRVIELLNARIKGAEKKKDIIKEDEEDQKKKKEGKKEEPDKRKKKKRKKEDKKKDMLNEFLVKVDVGGEKEKEEKEEKEKEEKKEEKDEDKETNIKEDKKEKKKRKRFSLKFLKKEKENKDGQ